MAVVLSLLMACSPRALITREVADELARQGAEEEEDLPLAREASAFYLKLSESMLRNAPDHLELARAVAAGFTQYAYAFVAFEADRVESLDARLAHELRRRASRFYMRAHRHAMKALELSAPGFTTALRSKEAEHWPRLRPEQIALAYWAAASWAAYISLSSDDPEVIADLPVAARLASLVWRTQPEFGDGGVASLMGSFEMARPGGSRSQAIEYFDLAARYGNERNASVFLARSEAIARPEGDQAAFEALLRQALEISERHRTASNQAVAERAQWLLRNVGDFF